MTNKNMPIYPVILAGGKGVRFWPLAREHHPKQVLHLFNNQSFLQTALKLVMTLPNRRPPLIITNEAYRFHIAEQTHQIVSDATILLETTPHDTALAVALAACFLRTNELDPLLLIMPADFYIPDAKPFFLMLQQAIDTALQGKLVTFGLEPTSANTGYGYIKKGVSLPDNPGYSVQNFIEKPTLESAQSYVASGAYYWNSGIFLFQASTILQALKHYAPSVLLTAQHQLRYRVTDPDFVRLSQEDGSVDCPTISIDKAVFEQTKDAVVFPFKGAWHDLGNWKSLHDVSPKDMHGNVMNENVVTFNTDNCYLYSNGPVLVTSGLHDCLVIATEDAIFVTPLDHEQPMKEIVAYLKKNKTAIVV